MSLPAAPGVPVEEASRPLLELPNGLRIAYQTRSEARFFYADIFEQEAYLRHGIALPDSAVVFDVGGNIGMFSLFVQARCAQPQLFVFEPVPELYAILSCNLRRYAPRARLFNCGLAERARRERFTFYPLSSGMSSLYADVEEEKEALRAVLASQARQGVPGMDEVLGRIDELLAERLRAVAVGVELRTLSEVVRAEGVSRIDLLKIDVQKAELDVLAGIADEHWPLVRQLVVEVHDLGGRLRRLRDELHGRGFEVLAEQDGFYTGSSIYNLYARRLPAPPGGRLERLDERAARQRRALQQRKDQRSSA